MRSMSMVLVVAAALSATAANAQTTGVFGCNDYTINGFGSGTTSCTKYTNPPGSPLSFSVSCGPTANQVYLVFSLCPCSAGFASVPPGCCGTLQTIDLNLGCSAGPNLILGPFTPTVNSAGLLGVTFTVPVCPAGFVFSTQAAVLDPTCPFPIQFTQAYDVCC